VVVLAVVGACILHQVDEPKEKRHEGCHDVEVADDRHVRDETLRFDGVAEDLIVLVVDPLSHAEEPAVHLAQKGAEEQDLNDEQESHLSCKELKLNVCILGTVA